MSITPLHILYVDDEAAYHRLFKRGILSDSRYKTETATNGEEALQRIADSQVDVVITDIRMPRMNGLALLSAIREQYPDIFVLIVTSVDSASEAVQALKAGAYDYILKPLDMDMIRKQLDKIYQHKQLLQQAITAQNDEFRFENIVGRDPAMFKLYEQIDCVAATDSTVLIHGESGTGKELIAAAIHARSNRKNHPFICVNCAAFTDTLVSSALFGHEKGAFTGALSRHIGHFESASGGTIFLDEIGDIPQQTQVSLLRVLELGSFYRVGGNSPISVDVRIVCATNRDLTLAMKEKFFREDLFYRINVVSLTAPPLRTRKADIPLLAQYFLEKFNQKIGKAIPCIEPDALALLTQHEWPGNVRELINTIERAVVFCKGSSITTEHLPATLQGTTQGKNTPLLSRQDTSLATMEQALILSVLESKSWNLSQAADALGIARGTLYSKMERYGIPKHL
ncbi:sigma-54-dependent transcriptional regulator [Chrysiogenes arsenatis]|uniref:sigma-54-dependent transcriptional regulator n=1 Tax=Chrysiogenes arsenatis TaxID=309797 RepID=UPI000414F04A|nr:sigma-54 dependent transcriptional regulator [Chrysiogenes arsenatis]